MGLQNLLERCRSSPMDATMWSSWKNTPRKTTYNPPIRAIRERQLMSSELPAHFGLAETGRAHDALADARALVQVLAHLQR